MFSGFKEKEPRYLCLSEARASHSHKTCTEVSSSVPHFLQVGSLLSPITCRCLLRVLCPVRRPITALDCVLLKDNRTVTSGALLWTLQWSNIMIFRNVTPLQHCFSNCGLWNYSEWIVKLFQESAYYWLTLVLISALIHIIIIIIIIIIIDMYL
jgi:hypothetical protein